ncbi:MAG: hypothetical protein U5K31_10420 [Balneolaceae bacterium]|nr:hypothetical protein [Balneolaceae bacterium]
MNTFDDRYKVYDWTNWLNLHWIINPGVAIVELVAGRRVPKVQLEDQESDEPRIARSYVPCPHCGERHPQATWSSTNGTASKNWFGLYCPECGEIIPCLINATTLLLLAVTFPIWGWFKSSLKQRWLERQPERYQNLDLSIAKDFAADYPWIKSGLSFAFFMYIIMTLLFPLVMGEALTWTNALIGVPIWVVAGLAYGYFMKRYFNKRVSAQK